MITIRLILSQQTTEQKGSDQTNQISKTVISSPLVFSIDEIKKLRDLGICGVLTGTLPSATQQNVFLSVPLRLMVEEAVWLYLNGYAKFSISTSPASVLLQRVLQREGQKLFDDAEARLTQSFELQRQFKLEKHLAKLKELDLDIVERKENENENGMPEKPPRDRGVVNESLMNSSLFVDIPNTSELIPKLREDMGELQVVSKQDNFEFGKKIVDHLISCHSSWDDYYIFQTLRDQGYVLSPGGRFGGKYIAYPGDPLRYHSHLTIRDAMDYYNEPIDFLALAGGARLGTSVKKLWVIGGLAKKRQLDEKEEQGESTSETTNSCFNIDSDSDPNPNSNPGPVSFYSIEWAGFG